MSHVLLGTLLDNLATLSPMPSDEALLEGEDELADQYDDLIEAISKHVSEVKPSPSEEARLVTALADSFGPGGGMGIFWGTLHLIERCTPNIAVPIIQDRAIHGAPGSRYWCCYILGRRRNEDDLPLFLTLLHDDVPVVQKQALDSLVMLSQRMSLKHIIPLIVPLTNHAISSVEKAAQGALDSIGAE